MRCLVAVSALLALSSLALADPPSFTVTQLPFNAPTITLLNNNGETAGVFTAGDGSTHLGIRDQGGNLADLGSFPDGAQLTSFNDTDLIIVTPFSGTNQIIYSRTGTSSIPPTFLSAAGITNSGLAIGTNQNGDLLSYNVATTEIAPYAGRQYQGTQGSYNPNLVDPVNGFVLGNATISTGGPTFSANFVCTPFGELLLQSPIISGAMRGINDRGEYMLNNSIVTTSKLIAIPNPNPGSLLVCLGLNDADQAVGGNFNNGQENAFLYTNGATYDLNSLVNLPGIELFSGWQVNNAGQILAEGSDQNGNNFFYLINPVNQFTVTANANISNAGAVAGGGSFLVGATDTVNATPSAGATFLGWTENGVFASTNLSYTFPVTHNRNLLANFGYLPAGLVVPTHVVKGGQSMLAMVNLGRPVVVDTVLNLATDDPSFSVPSTVTVPAGSAAGTFTISTIAVPNQINAHVLASGSGATYSASISVLPPQPITMTCNPTGVVGGNTVSFTVNLDTPAPTGGFELDLSSSDPSVNASLGTVFVPEGLTTVTFNLPTNPVTSTILVLVKAQHGSNFRRVGVVVRPR